MGSLPGWWLGAESGRKYSPTLTLPQWDRLLNNCGFAGIETSTPSIHPLIPLHVFCSQAVDERIHSLRDPLTQDAIRSFDMGSHLVVIGGKSFTTHKICGQIIESLGSMFHHIRRLWSIEELNEENLPEGSTVLSLTELDEPLFLVTTAQKFNGLKYYGENRRTFFGSLVEPEQRIHTRKSSMG